MVQRQSGQSNGRREKRQRASRSTNDSELSTCVSELQPSSSSSELQEQKRKKHPSKRAVSSSSAGASLSFVFSSLLFSPLRPVSLPLLPCQREKRTHHPERIISRPRSLASSFPPPGRESKSSSLAALPLPSSTAPASSSVSLSLRLPPSAFRLPSSVSRGSLSLHRPASSSSFPLQHTTAAQTLGQPLENTKAEKADDFLVSSRSFFRVF